MIIYRTLVQIPLFQNKTFRPVAQMIASMSGAMVNLVLIMMLGRVYEKMALKLTTWGKKKWRQIFFREIELFLYFTSFFLSPLLRGRSQTT